jgi:O-antigen ligase
MRQAHVLLQSEQKVISWANYLIAIVLVLVPFHTFLSLWLSTFIGHFTLIRLWKEVIVVVICILVGRILYLDKRLRAYTLKTPLFRLMAVYAFFCIVVTIVSYILHGVSLYAASYGLLLDLRFLVWFALVYIVSMKSQWLHKNSLLLVAVPLLIVVVFGLLQFFVLPRNFLQHFGYNNGHTQFISVVPLNQDSQTVRIQSFLRGANPLGAYLAACSIFVAGYLLKKKKNYYLMVLLGMSLLALFLTFSRSSWLGFFLAIGFIGRRVLSKKWLVVLAGVAVMCIAALILASVATRNAGVQNALLHVNDQTTASTTSNEGHASAAQDSLKAFLQQPFGRGAGAAGQASWYNVEHQIINTESYLLQVALETGFTGIILFALLLIWLYRSLTPRSPHDSITLAAKASFVGFVIINLFSYGWTDDTLSYIWWGLIAIAITQYSKLSYLNAKKI